MKKLESTGRDIFAKNISIINFLCSVVNMLPEFVKRALWNLSFNVDSKFSTLLRYCIISSICKKVGRNVYIGPSVIIKNARNLVIGDNVSIHFGCYIDAAGGCEIGSNVSIAHMSSIVTFEHTWNDLNLPIKYNPIRKKKVTVGDDVWVGCGVRILSGSCISGRVVIAAGAVVTGNCESSTLYGGVPARPLKPLAK